MPDKDDLDMTTLDDVRMKDAADLTDDDKAILKDNEDYLTDEEKEEFKSVLGGGEPEKKETEKKEPEKEPEGFAFKSQAELDAYIDKKLEDRIKKDEEPEGEPEETVEFLPKDYKPKTWNDVAADLFPKFMEKFQEMSTKEKQKTQEDLKRINEDFDKEIEGLRTSGEEIPEKGSKEFNEFNRELAQIGTEYKGVSNMTEAYQIYKALKGSGKAGVSDSQKRAASRVASGGGGGGGGEKPKKYIETTGKSFDDRIEAATRALESGG